MGIAVVALLAGRAEASYKSVAQTRVRLTKRALADAQAMYRAGRGTAELVYRWSVRLLHARIAVAPSARARAARTANHLARMKKLAAAVVAKIHAGAARASDRTAAEYFVAEAQLWLYAATHHRLPARSSGP